MGRFNRSLVIASLFGALVLTVGVGISKAAYGDPRLDSIASTIAGKPVAVWCPSSLHEWAKTEDTAGLTFEATGFTYVGRTPAVIYLSQQVCDTLEGELNQGPTVVGDYWNGLAIRAFVHEATHQRLNSQDETVVECATLATIRGYLPLFGYTPTITQATYVKVRDGHYKRVTKVVPNPATARVMQWIKFWDGYHAVCS